MMVTLNTICRRAEQIKRAEERKAKIANFAKGVLSCVLFGAVLYGFIAIPSYLHSRNCDGCNWFWCNNYTGEGDI